MGILTSLVGGSGNMILNAALALGIVLILIVLGLWGLKVIFRASTNVGRGRNRRLAVVDTLPVDGKRQLVIVRRDNVEHLILTGGGHDLVVESGFVAEASATAPRPIPTVRRPAGAGPQRAPAPQRATEAGSASGAGEAAETRGPLGRLRNVAPATGNGRNPPSLRHTGLMSPVSRMEPVMVPANADNATPPEPDSATRSRVTPFGGPREKGEQAFGDDGKSGYTDSD